MGNPTLETELERMRQRFEVDYRVNVAERPSQADVHLEWLSQQQRYRHTKTDLRWQGFQAGYTLGLSQGQQLAELLRKAQWIVHCGKEHQWEALEHCTESDCKAVLAAMKAVKNGD